MSNSKSWGFESRKHNFRIPVLDNYSRLLLYIGIPQDLIPDPGSKPS